MLRARPAGQGDHHGYGTRINNRTRRCALTTSTTYASPANTNPTDSDTATTNTAAIDIAINITRCATISATAL